MFVSGNDCCYCGEDYGIADMINLIQSHFSREFIPISPLLTMTLWDCLHSIFFYP